MAMTAFHRFTRRLLWRVAGLCTILLVAAWMFGAGSVWQIVEWIPMTIVIVHRRRTPRVVHPRARVAVTQGGW